MNTFYFYLHTSSAVTVICMMSNIGDIGQSASLLVHVMYVRTEYYACINDDKMLKNELRHDQLYPLTVPSPTGDVKTIRVFQDGVELNWLPPTEPNGEVHYVIYYTPEGGTEQSTYNTHAAAHYLLCWMVQVEKGILCLWCLSIV